jgi:hypothetical protein
MRDGLYSLAEAAAYLTIAVRTLRGHVKDGTISYVVTGRGKKRPAYAFAQADLDAFEEQRRRRRIPIVSRACPSSGRPAASTTITTSGSGVIAFTELRARRASATPKR